ncbi:hypothetical protein [Aquisphaera insulae]|uniref:hypothetical protein n=1 Tax=Aquisphaera insulae TaxID=2712864 RepID=UPI0013EBB2F3|nr:hypothetical protein [Aquisphaera insulae]
MRKSSAPRAACRAAAKYSSQAAMPWSLSALQARKTALISGSIVVSQASPPSSRTSWCRWAAETSPPAQIQSRRNCHWPRSQHRPCSMVSSSATIAAALRLGSSTQPVHASSDCTSARNRAVSSAEACFGFVRVPGRPAALARKADSAFSACSIFQESAAAVASSSRSRSLPPRPASLRNSAVLRSSPSASCPFALGNGVPFGRCPGRSPLRRDRALPAFVLGPVDSRAFRRLASSWAVVAIVGCLRVGVPPGAMSARPRAAPTLIQSRKVARQFHRPGKITEIDAVRSFNPLRWDGGAGLGPARKRPREGRSLPGSRLLKVARIDPQSSKFGFPSAM